MNNLLKLFVLILIMLASCQTQKKFQQADFNPPKIQKDLTYYNSSDLITANKNNLRKGWALRNHVQVLQVKIINNTEKPIHGSQLDFFSENKKLEIINHQLASEKLRTKHFPTFVYIVPVVLVGVVIYAAITEAIGEDYRDADNDGFTDQEYTDNFPKKKKDPMKKMNLIQQKLYIFNIAEQRILPGGQIEGLIAFKSESPIHGLEIRVNDVEYYVTQH